MKNIIFPIGAITLIFLVFSNKMYKEETINIINEEIKDVSQKINDVEQDLKINDVDVKENILKHNETPFINSIGKGVGFSIGTIGSIAAGFGIYKGGKWAYKKGKAAYIERKKKEFDYEFIYDVVDENVDI